MAAIWAGSWAKAAAKHTEAGALEAAKSVRISEDAVGLSRTAIQADLRAWVVARVTLVEARRNEEYAYFAVKVDMTNVGQTPALDMRVGVRVYCSNNIQIGDGEKVSIDDHLMFNQPHLAPSGTGDQKIGERVTTEDIEKAVTEFAKRGGWPVIFVDSTVSYRTVFDDRQSPRRVTSQRHIIVPAYQANTPQHVWRRWLDDGPAGTDSVRFDQVRNAPTEMT